MIMTKNEPVVKASYEPIALDFSLYLITDRHLCVDASLLEAAEMALKGGVKAIQLREKDLRTRELLRLAYDLRKLTLKYDARLFINDRVDIAIAVEADGVHLGQRSIPPFAVRRMISTLIIGVSAHNIEEARKAKADGADFITYGPVFETPSKAKYGAPVGLDGLSTVTAEVDIPIFAIGGIKPENLKDAMDTGAAGVALISGIFAAKKVKPAAMKYLRLLK
jgi:thiamine-phosphate pyrophosphorylase